VSRLPLVDKVPVSGCGRVDGRGFEDGSGDSVEERSIDDISVTGDPSDIGHAGELVVWVNVKDVFDGKLSSEEVSRGRVDNSFWLAGRSGGLVISQIL
jgi:hypothetical protein